MEQSCTYWMYELHFLLVQDGKMEKQVEVEKKKEKEGWIQQTPQLMGNDHETEKSEKKK